MRVEARQGNVGLMCPVCGHDAIVQSATHAFVESSCARCGRLLARTAMHARVGAVA